MKTLLFAALALSITGSLALAQSDKPATPAQNTPAAEKPAEQASLQYVKFETTEGSFVLELNSEKAPISVENFMKYVEKGFYDGTIFHRVMFDFMIQGGGMDEKGNPKKTDRPIVNEHNNGLKNKRGSISMARTNDPNSATSQFFINVADNDGTAKYNLDAGAGYAVFGKVVQGMDTIDKIRNGETTVSPRGEKSVPVKPVVVTKASKLSKADADKLIEGAKEEAPKADAPKADAPKADPKPKK